MSHFHHSQHLKGGIEIDMDSMPENSRYWETGARWAYGKLCEKIGEKRANLITPFWNTENSWKEICLLTEKILEDKEIKGENHEESV